MELREQKYKQAAEEMANVFKEKIRKEKEAYKKAVEGHKEEKMELEGQLRELREEIESIGREGRQFIEKSKITIDMTMLHDDSKKDISFIFQSIGANLSQIDQRITDTIGESWQMLIQIVQCLREAGMEFEFNEENIDESKALILSKINELLQNYQEDKR